MQEREIQVGQKGVPGREKLEFEDLDPGMFKK